MEQIRAERQRHHASSVHRDGVGGSAPALATAAQSATGAAGGAVSTRWTQLCARRMRWSASWASWSGRRRGQCKAGVASAMGAAVPKDVAFLHLGDG